jgi:hypothetical protein
MATPSKTPQMKAIIKDIAKLNPSIKALTYDDFVKGEAKELLNIYTDESKILKQKELLHKIAQVPMNVIDKAIPSTNSQDINNFNHTALFFGIDESMKALINKLSCEIYSNIIIDERQLTDGIIEDGYMYQELKQGFDNWIKLCIKLDNFKRYFDTLDKQKQEQLKQGLKLLVNAPFIEDDNIAKEFNLFLTNHKLSQLTKFKEKKLMELKLPNVNTQEIAKDIHKFTKFRYNTKLY